MSLLFSPWLLLPTPHTHSHPTSNIHTLTQPGHTTPVTTILALSLSLFLYSLTHSLLPHPCICAFIGLALVHWVDTTTTTTTIPYYLLLLRLLLPLLLLLRPTYTVPLSLPTPHRQCHYYTHFYYDSFAIEFRPDAFTGLLSHYTGKIQANLAPGSTGTCFVLCSLSFFLPFLSSTSLHFSFLLSSLYLSLLFFLPSCLLSSILLLSVSLA